MWLLRGNFFHEKQKSCLLLHATRHAQILAATLHRSWTCALQGCEGPALKKLWKSYKTPLLDVNWWVEWAREKRAVSRPRAAFQHLICNVTEGTAGGRPSASHQPQREGQTDRRSPGSCSGIINASGRGWVALYLWPDPLSPRESSQIFLNS